MLLTRKCWCWTSRTTSWNRSVSRSTKPRISSGSCRSGSWWRSPPPSWRTTAAVLTAPAGSGARSGLPSRSARPSATCRLKARALKRCRCGAAGTGTFSPLSNMFSAHVAPEMVYLETRWASLVSFDATVGLLKDVLPVGATLNAETVRNHLHQVANRMEGELGGGTVRFQRRHARGPCRAAAGRRADSRRNGWRLCACPRERRRGTADELRGFGRQVHGRGSGRPVFRGLSGALTKSQVAGCTRFCRIRACR